MQEDNPITDGSLAKAILDIFVPTLFSLGASAAIGIVDIFLSGSLGSAEQAAVGIADQLLFLCTMAGAGLATASVACVSRHLGARRTALSRLYARDCLLLAAFVGILAAVICAAFARPIISLFHCDNTTAQLAVHYAIANAPANAAYLLALCLVAIMRALGQPRIGLLVWIVMSSVSNVLSIIFFAHGGFVRSLDGLGIAWDVGSFSGVSIGLYLFLKIDPQFRQCLAHDFAGSPTRIRALVETAVPAITAELAPVFSNFALYRVLSNLEAASAAQAAWTIRMKLEETIATMPLAALAMAVAVVVGQNLGAGRSDRALKAAFCGCLVAVVMMICLGGLMTAYGDGVVQWFTREPNTRAATDALLVPFIVILPCMALTQILCGALDGAALTKIPMLINCVGLVLVRCGIACIAVSFGFGIGALVQATLISAVIAAVMSVLGFAGTFVRSRPGDHVVQSLVPGNAPSHV